MTTSTPRRNPVLAQRGHRGALWALLVAGILGTGAATAGDLRIGGTGGSLAAMRMLGDEFAKSRPGTRVVVLPSLGSSGGIKAVLAGAIEVGVSARPLKEAERGAGAIETEYGLTPFVFATATSRAGPGLGLKDLVEIYAGRMDRWPDGTRIRLVLRPIGDSDSEMIKDMSPAMREALGEAERRKGTAFAVTDQDAADSLEKIQGALGPTTLAQILTEGRALKPLSLDGIEPSVDTLAGGRYPYHKRLFLVTTAKSPPMAHEFVAFVKSANGRKILARTGHWVK
jgi:phosphate transport system substrate-binding protein